MNKTPTVSVIVPAYNVAPYIAETIQSVLAQSYRDFELIVVNDGSTDQTKDAIAAFLGSIVYLEQQNGGVMRARNAGLNAARGRYVALLDGDDLWKPQFLETLVAMLDADAQLTAVYPNAVFLGSPNFAGRQYQDVFPASEPVTFDRVLRRECYIFGSLVFRRSALDDVGGFDAGLEGQGAEDLDLWLRMLKRGQQFKFTRDVLVSYRWRRDSLSNTGVGLMRCLVSVYQKLLAGELTAAQRQWVESQMPELRAQLDFALFKDAAAKNHYQEAARHLAAANKFYRRPKLVAAQIAMKFAPGLVAKLAAK